VTDPDPADPLAEFKGPTSKDRERGEGISRKRRGERGREMRPSTG